MFKLIHEIQTNGGVAQLNRYHHTITAYDGVQDLLSIDTKHQLIVRKKLQYPPTSVRCFNWQGRFQYFIITLNRIERSDGSVVSSSNSKSQFTKCIDCSGSSLIFSKYHHNYKKYSLNYLWEGTKRIIKLLDLPVKSVIFNPYSHQVIYNVKDGINCLDLNKVETEVQLFKKSTFLSDTNNLYSLSLNMQNKAKDQYEIGIFDFKSGKNTDSFFSKEPPIKIQSFSKSLLVATKNAIQFYDIRKLIKPFDREVVKGIQDFLYEPNINKLYMGCENKLRIYQS